MLNDYHIHALSHGEYKHTIDWLSLFVKKAQQERLSEIGFAEHDEFRHLISFDNIQHLKGQFPDIKIRIGLEVDYIPGREEEIKLIKDSHDWDYLIGSVHFIDDWAFDHPDHKGKFNVSDIDEIYYKYFMLVKQAVETNYFDVVGHLDLVKIWGNRPLAETTSYYVKPVLEIIKDSGMAVEINSSGLRKPVKEIYPAPEIITQMYSMEIPILFGSDAHHPDQVGMDYQEAVLHAKRAGYHEIVVFNDSKKQTIKF